MSESKKTTGKSSQKKSNTQKKKRSSKTRLRVVRKPSGPDVEFMDAPSLRDMQAPSGFRVVSYSQAMMEYAAPVLEGSESQDMNALNEKMQVAMLCWNHSIAGELVGPRFSDKEIIDKIGKVLKLSKQETSEFFKKMIERKSYLFPEELQQRGVPFMVMRKEISHIIAPFDLRRINFLEKPMPPDQKDKKFINNLNKLDSFIMRRAEYDEYEDLFTQVSEGSTEIFERWLIAKGVEEFRQELVWFPDTLCNFVYGYLHEDAFVLKSIPPGYLAVFFSDFVLRKVMIEPHMYSYIPPSIKLFYTFLWEKKILGQSRTGHGCNRRD
ncbi:MAG: hypothetical protein ACLQPD_02995 [Desulfomonilaceae bacterium]